MKSSIRVLCVDDSIFFRKVLTGILGEQADIELVSCVSDPYAARDYLVANPVDVLTLDLELPRMGGLTFLKLIMEQKPLPVIVLSAQTPTGSQKAVEALITGAFDVIEKPVDLTAKNAFAEKLVRGIRHAATEKLRRTRPLRLNPSLPVDLNMAPATDPRNIIALGASTGGTQALQTILSALPNNLPGIVVVQHIPAGFSKNFADRLNQLCDLDVREAKDGDVIRPGLALVAPGDHHLEVEWTRDHYTAVVHDGPKVEHQRPSVDVLFQSLAQCAGRHAIAGLLSGMGKDGAAGAKELHDLGAYTIAQDSQTSVVYGMARRAVELDAIDEILPLEEIAQKIVHILAKRNRRTAPVLIP